MTATRHIGKDTVFSIGNPPTSDVSYTAFAQLTDFSGPSTEVKTVDVTTYDDDATVCLPVIVDNGEVTFSVVYDSDTHDDLVSLARTPIVAKWKVTFPDASVQKFDGILTKFEPKAGGVEDKLTADVTIKISGEIADS